MSAQLQDSVLGRINDLLSELGRTKAASSGDSMGKTTHPSDKVDNNTQKAQEGERARENTADVKKTFPAPIVDNVDPHSGGSQDSHQLNIGVRSSATGEDPSVEDDFKGQKDDPGTSHPANVEEIGDKYGSAVPTEVLFKQAYAMMDDVLATIASMPPAPAKQAQAQQYYQAPAYYTDADAVQKAAQAGYQIAADAGVEDQLAQEKLAWTQHLVYQAWQEGQEAGEKVARYILDCQRIREQQLKQAEDPSMGAGLPPELLAGAAAPASAGGPPGASADHAPPEGGGMAPPESGHEGGMGMGGDAPPHGGGGEHDAINELANALIEAGIPPEQLLAAVEQASGGQGGEAAGLPAPAMGGEKAGASRAKISPEDRPLLVKLAQDVIRHRNAGRTRLKEAKEGSAARQARNEVISYVREICGR